MHDPIQCVIVAQNTTDGEKIERATHAGNGHSSARNARGNDSPARTDRRERIESEVRDLMYQSSEIEIGGADTDTNLFELGFASLMIARLKDLIKRAYGLDVQMSWFYSQLDTFNKTVDYIDKESAVDTEPTQKQSTLPATAAPQSTRIEGGVDRIISRQMEVMARQLALMSEQLNMLRGAERGHQQALLKKHGALLQEMHAGKAIDGGNAKDRELKPPAKIVRKREEYVAYRGITAREKLSLNTRQREHLQGLIGRYTRLTPGSKERTGKYRPVFANTRNIAGFRPEWKEMIYQIIVDRADGSHFTDVDGQDYLDISMGFGVYLFGHNPSFVQAELQKELLLGTPIGPMSDRAGQVATLIHELTGVERVAFFNTGTEAVMAAVRIARTVTGRKKVALFSGSYHGHFDGVLAVKDFDGPVGGAVPMSPGTPPEMVQDLYVLDYGTEETLHFLESHGRELAAVLVEPVQSRRPDFQPADFLKKVRELTTATESALIFDEMILGFRVHPGGAQAWFDVRADIVTYGKVVGGGLPIGVVAGKAYFLDAVDGGMWHYGDGSFPERENTFIAGTFNHHPLAMAGAQAVLAHLKKSGPSLQENLNRRTEELAERLNDYFEAEALPIRMRHFGSLFRIPVKGDQELFFYHLLSRGIYIWEGRNCFLSTAHTNQDIDYFVRSVQQSVEEMRAGGLFGSGAKSISNPQNVGVGDRTATIPMSSAQKRLYVVSRMQGGELAYHINGALLIDGVLDREKIESCFQTIIGRHESLKTGFEILDDMFIQRVHEQVEFKVTYSDRSPENIDGIIKEFIKPFDLAKPPLIRVGLVRFSADRHLLMIDAHHIVIDGISLVILAQEFMRLYMEETLLPVTLSYRDYVEWEQKLLVSEGLNQQEAYWLERLSGKLFELRLPLDYPRPPRQSFEGGVVCSWVGREKTDHLKALARKTGSTLYMVLFCAFNVLLHKLSGQTDIIIGTSSSGRDHLGFESIFGMCTNTLAIRNAPEVDKSFVLFLDELKMNCLKAFDNQDYPFDLLTKKLNLQRDLSRNPLVDTFFVFEEADKRVVKIRDLTFTPYTYEKQASAFDLFLEVIEEAGQLYLNMEYCAGLFKKETVARFLRYFLALLDQIVENPYASLGDFRLRSDSRETQDERYRIACQPKRDSVFPLSHHQDRLWFVERFESGYLYASSPVYYNLPLLIHIAGIADPSVLEKSLNRIIERHEILRTTIVTSDGQAVQSVRPQSVLKISVQELPVLPGQDAGSVLLAQALTEIRRPLSMEQEPPIRSTLLTYGNEASLLVITLHHIIADPWSTQIVAREIAEVYNSIATGTALNLVELSVQFADFATWEKQTGDELLADNLLALRLKLDGKIRALELPTDRPRPAIHTYHDGMWSFGLSRDLSEQLNLLATQEGVSLYVLLLAAFQSLLHRYCGQELVVVGTPTARRDRMQVVNAVGPFANLLVIPSDFSKRPSFRDLLNQVARSLTGILEYQDVPFDRLVLALNPEKDMSRTALFDVMFQVRESPVALPAMNGLHAEVRETNLGWGKYDLNLFLETGPNGLSGIMVYNKDLFDDPTVEAICNHYRVQLDSIVKNPAAPVSELRILTDEEERQQIFEWNTTQTNYPKDKTIHRLFEEQVENTPDNTAVIMGDAKMSYGELNRSVNKLAHYLRKKGVVPDQLVGICMERSLSMIIAMLAILKAGGAYVPMDPSYPKDRLRFMLEDTGWPLVITTEHERQALPTCPAAFVSIDAEEECISRECQDNPVNCNIPENLAYVIYTSGSTGTPKGVLIEHRNVVRLMINDKFPFEFMENDVWTMFHSYCFDFSVWEMYGALLYGGKLVIVPKEVARDSDAFLSLLKENKVTILNQTPRSFYNLAGLEVAVPDKCLSLRYVIFGGEALKPEMLRAFNQKYPEVKLVNMYGITETTVHVTFKEITGAQIRTHQSNVGRPIPTLTAYIMNEDQKLLPVGVPGELLVGGAGVARGYLNRVELTEEKFVLNPYKAGERLYRSGDLAKFLPNGEIEYLGRMDQQVKIRGYRIELGEIETTLLRHPRIGQVAVLAREDEGGDRFLCAYLVTDEDIPIENLRCHLGLELPEYMIPSQFFRIEKMPLTSNGKVDTKALLRIESTGLKPGTGFAEPETEHEVLLAGIWKAVLGRSEIGMMDNYFALGGDSIKAIQILARLKQHHLKLEVRHIFETPTIRELAKKLTVDSRISLQEVITGRVPLTAIQTWFFTQYGKNSDQHSDHYAQAVFLRSQDPVDENALCLSLRKLQEHHDSLRTIFRCEGESVVQEITDLEYPLDLRVVDLTAGKDAQQELDRVSAQVPSSLQIDRGPMLKTVLFRQDDEERILIVIHHLVVDGVSWRILIEDLCACYDQAIAGRNLELPQKSDAFRLWAEKIDRYRSSPQLIAEIPYWQQFEAVKALEIPTDFTTVTNRYEDLATVRVELDRIETQALMTKASRAYRTEVSDLLLTAFGRAMKRCYGAKKGFIDIEGHGREPIFEDIDISRTIGWFTSIYPALIDVAESDEVGVQIKQIKEGLKRIPNKGIGYGILKYLAPTAQRSQMQFKRGSRILFNYLGSFDIGTENRFGIDARPAVNTIGRSFERESEIVIEGAVMDQKLKLSLSYNANAHSNETVNRFLLAYRDELLSVITHCITRESEELTPSDLTFKDLKVSELDNILSGCAISIANLKDIYPLSALQEGMLFHALLESGSAAYFMQISFGIDGELKPDIFKTCWDMLIARHDILRTVFTHKGADRPLQIVTRQGSIDFKFEDISDFSEARQHRYLTEFKNRDREEGFDLRTKVPMRVRLFKKADRSFAAIWSYHHLLIDGWCAGILMSEFFETYGILLQGKTPSPRPAAPYGEYIRWIEQLDHQSTIDYWSTYLQGYDHPAILPKKFSAQGVNGFSPETLMLEIGPSLVENLKRFAADQQVTVNTLMQCAWGFVLARYAGADDVVFGATVSGRPAQVDEIETMAGLFINTIPVRIRINPDQTMAQLVKEVQADAVKSQAHHYTSLADIQAATPLKQQLIDHVMVFENYPLAEELIGLERKYPLGFGIEKVQVIEQTHYDLIIVVEPGEKVRVEIRYNAAVFTRDLIGQVQAAFGQILGSVAGGANITIGELRLSVMSSVEKNEREAFIKSAQEISEDF